MDENSHLTNRDDQFRSKRAARQAAANAPYEEKFDKLLQLQKINSELARNAGRPVQEPWNVKAWRKKSI